MTDRNLYVAARQYATRPADERFADLPALLAACQADDTATITGKTALEYLAAKADDREVLLNGRNNAAKLSHWSFGQLAALAGAPGSYLRTLPAPLAADCINHGFSVRKAAADATRANGGRRDDDVQQLYVRKPDDPAELPTIRAITSDAYTRVLDSSIVRPLVDLQQHNPDFQLPMTWEGTRAGAYRGDRDLFVILTDGGSIVEDPTLRASDGPGAGGNARAMYRGVIVKNSEVGACSLQLHVVLFRFICGNHIIWNVEGHHQFRRRHVGARTAAEFFTQLRSVLRDLQTRPATVDLAYVNALAHAEPWKDSEALAAALAELGLTEADSKRTIDAAEQYEPNPRSVWGVINGLTRASQAAEFSSERLTMDLLAAKLARKYARVAA